jgi:hypothetical protein
MNVILTYTQFFAWQGLAGAYAGAQKITKKPAPVASSIVGSCSQENPSEM